MSNYHTYDFPDSKCLVACGDIHGDLNLLVNKICVQYQLKDTVVIAAGDCGFGFERKGAYENMVHKSTKNLLHKFSKKTVLILLSLILLHPFVNFKVRQDWNHGQRMMTLSCMTFSKSVPLWTTYTML